jgi:Flp pilus assembly protein TadB
MNVPTSPRGLYALTVTVLALIGAVFAATLGGAVLVVVSLTLLGYALYVVGYRTDKRLRESDFGGNR